MVPVAALVAWALNLVLGLTMLRHWSRPPRTVFFHLASACVGLAAWLVFVVANGPGWLAWAVFVWLNLTLALGDVLMVGGWRRRTPEPRPRGARAYVASARDALSLRRPVATAHAVLAPTTLALVLVAALGS